MRFVKVFLCLLFPILAAAQTPTPLGTAVTTKSHVQSSLTYTDGTTLVITTSTDATVTLSLYLDASMSAGLKSALPSGANTLAFAASANTGFTLTVSPQSAVIVSATLSTPSLSSTATAALTGQADLGVLWLNTTTNTFQNINIQSYDVTTGRCVLLLPSTGTYIFISFKSATVIPATYAQPKTHDGTSGTTTSSNRTYWYSSDFTMQFNSTARTTLNVYRYSAANQSLESSSSKARGVASFKFDEAANSANFSASLVFQYNQSVVEGMGYKAANLAWWTFDVASGAWKQVPSSVNVQTSTVVALTSHFSEWSVAVSGSMRGVVNSRSVLGVAVLLALVVGMV
ncbi:hypothetical protein HDV00_006293 [Rhizophlyctis rosea]|nr:hypothetical protein HDV00_006293 [Rhizophlyctis rosea]